MDKKVLHTRIHKDSKGKDIMEKITWRLYDAFREGQHSPNQLEGLEEFIKMVLDRNKENKND